MLTCSYPYPTSTQVAEAATNEFKMLSGAEPFDTACAVHCAGTLAMYGASVAFPDGCPAPTPATPPTAKSHAETKSAFLAALKPVAESKDSDLASFDWKTIARLALQFVLQLLG